MVSLPDSGWVRALLDMKPTGALVVAVGLFVVASLGPVPDWAFVLLILAAVVCLAPPANWLAECVGARLRARREARRRPEVLARLSDLGPNELEILASCVRSNEQSFNCFLGDPTATSLRHKGLAILPTWSGDLRRHPHIIPDYVWEELRHRSQEILSAVDAQERAKAQRLAPTRKKERWLRGPYG
jgi:hypothetical protein